MSLFNYYNHEGTQKSVSDWRLNAANEDKTSSRVTKNGLQPFFSGNHHLVKSLSTGGIMNYTERHYQSADENDSNEFVDAPEEVIYSESLELLDTLAETHIAMNLFMNNQFELAEERMAVLAHKSMYHALGYSTMLSIRAVMTCDRGDLERAMEACRNASIVIGQFRAKYSFTESLYKFGGQKRVLTDAEALMFRAVLTFFYDENLASLIKGAFKIRTCYQSFKECQKILNSEFWVSRDPRIKSQFEAGVRMGVGTFNLMLSTLPSKVLRLLEVVGFSGNKVSFLSRKYQNCFITKDT
uniref:Tetratricopeptide repeat protein 39B n=1 Tax=Acrobeloides nanus TaxID=290746 RepID=A0A914E6J8_9BILA